MQRPLQVFACLGALVLAGDSAGAGTVRVQIGSRARIDKGVLSATVEVGNLGSEAAYDLELAVWQGARRSPPVLESRLEPNRARAARLEVSAPFARGRWPYLVRVRYSDKTGARHEAIHAGLVTLGSVDGSSVSLTSLPGNEPCATACLAAQIHNAGQASHQVQLGALAPAALGTPEPLVIGVGAGTKEQATLAFDVGTGARGGPHTVFLVAEHDEDGVHHTSLVRTRLELEAPPRRLAHLLAVASGLTTLGWLALVIRRRGRLLS